VDIEGGIKLLSLRAQCFMCLLETLEEEEGSWRCIWARDGLFGVADGLFDGLDLCLKGQNFVEFTAQAHGSI
jgi:hypothetical protein